MRFWRVCAVQLVIPNGVVTNGIVPPYSGPRAEPPVPMKVFTQSTGVLSPGTSAPASVAIENRNSRAAVFTPGSIGSDYDCSKRTPSGYQLGRCAACDS